MRADRRSTGAAALLVLATLSSCAETSHDGENMPPIIGGPTTQRVGSLKDINLENESQNMDKLKAINAPGR